MAHFLNVFKEENVSADIANNKINIFYVISHDKLKCEYIGGDSCRHIFFYFKKKQNTEELVSSAHFYENCGKIAL